MKTVALGLVVAMAVALPRVASAQQLELRIGTVSGQLAITEAAAFQPFTDYLAAQVPEADFRMVPLPTIEALVAAVERGELDFALATPVAFVALSTRHEVRPIATVTQMVAGSPSPWLAGAVFTKASRTDIRQLADVRGKRLLALSPMALGGWLAADREWRAIGIDARRDPAAFDFLFSYANIAQAVCDGTADVGVVPAAMLQEVSPRCADGFRVLPRRDGRGDTRFAIAASTPLYPEAAFAAVAPVDERLVTRVVQALLAITPGSDVARAATVAGFTAPLSYEPVRDLMQALRVAPYDAPQRLTFADALSQHAGKVTIVLLGFVSVLTVVSLRARRLNQLLVGDLAERGRAAAERARLQAQLERSQRLDSIGRLAGAVAHDFNNLLTVINGYAEVALEDLPDRSPVRETLSHIRTAGGRAAALTQQLLTFSKKQIGQPVPLNLNELLHESYSMCQRLLREDIRMFMHLAPGIAPILADPAQMHQVLINLVVNARDAMPDGGTLTIATAGVDLSADAAAAVGEIAAGAYLLFTVADTGVGMDSETQQHVFEPFFSTKGDAGMGLGLATVYGIVRQYQGGIMVASERGRGTTFSIYLPTTTREAKVERAVPVRRQVAPAGPRTVLVVEDQQDVRGFARDVLSSGGYTVLEAASGDEALRLVDATRTSIDLLLTDVVLVGMNGRELAEQFRQRHPEAPVLYTSGYPDDETARRGVIQGTAAFLPKPYSAPALLAKVADMIDESGRSGVSAAG